MGIDEASHARPGSSRAGQDAKRRKDMDAKRPTERQPRRLSCTGCWLTVEGLVLPAQVLEFFEQRSHRTVELLGCLVGAVGDGVADPLHQLIPNVR